MKTKQELVEQIEKLKDLLGDREVCGKLRIAIIGQIEDYEKQLRLMDNVQKLSKESIYNLVMPKAKSRYRIIQSYKNWFDKDGDREEEVDAFILFSVDWEIFTKERSELGLKSWRDFFEDDYDMRSQSLEDCFNFELMRLLESDKRFEFYDYEDEDLPEYDEY